MSRTVKIERRVAKDVFGFNLTHKVLVETWRLFGVLPVYRRETIVEL